MGYQKKGYTSGEIGVAWLQDWDKLTKQKANGRHCLLIVDGHSSHYTLAFLDYARKNTIIVLCYPSHSTHVYQGLDVVIFSVLKWAWSNEHDKFEKSGPAVSKLNFLSIYARAHARAFTKENILAAFSKTGIVPFNPDVVTEAMMAPSLETSISSALPLALASPIQEVVDLISHHQARKCRREDDSSHKEFPQGSPQTPKRTRAVSSSSPAYTPVRRGLQALGSTSASFLISDSPLASSSCLPALQMIKISPHTYHDQALLSLEPSTEREQELMTALTRSHQVAALQKEALIGMQAQTILHSMYIKDIRGQLQGKEEKKKKGMQTSRINMDGQAKVLTQDQVFEAVQESQAAQDAAKEASSKRKDAKERYLEAMEVWKVREMDRKARNGEVKAGWVKEVKNWGVEKDSAKTDHWKPRWNKPKMPSMEKALPKPKLCDFAEESEEEEENDEVDDGENSNSA